MKSFFKQVFAVIVGMFLVGVLFFIVIVSMITAAVSSAGDSAESFKTNSIVKIEDHSVLKLNLSNSIMEQDRLEDFNFTGGSFKMTQNLGLRNLLKAIEAAKVDDKIEGIYIELSTMPSGFATADAVRRALIDFKTSDKFIIAYGEYASQKAYYVASVADKIYINPEGIVEMRGIGTQLTFFKRFLDKIEAEVQVFKVGTFKSAIEPFIREDISVPNRKQLEFLLGGIKEDFIRNISESRHISKAELEEDINGLKISSAANAVELKLIDAAFYADQVFDDINERIGQEKDEKIHFIDINKYGTTIKKKSIITENEIAIVFAEGEIVSSKADDKISSEEYAKIISDLRKDDDIKAIVLRINSPGGSALASEVIWREIELAKQTKKVVVSMGNVAASGGYYIACGADYIFAEENTITGSIGVFGLIPNMEKFLENKIGVTFDEVNLNTHATMNGVSKKFDDLEHHVIQTGVERVYKTFTNRVAEGREMDIEKVKKYAEGRVWTGQQALEIGFVDKIGDLEEAIVYAAEIAELEEYKTKEYPRKKDPMEKILSDLGFENIKTRILKSEMGTNYKYYEQVKNIETNFNTIQMRMPFDIEVK